MTGDFPKWAYAAALAALPLQTHQRLRRVLNMGSPQLVWHDIMSSRVTFPGISQEALRAWRTHDLQHVRKTYEACRHSEVVVVTCDDPRYPSSLLHDPTAPAVLFVRGQLPTSRVPTVGIVGTRRATQYGRHFARLLGRELARHGVSVVSGLARGIDVEAHRGALEESDNVRPLAVVASGPDVVYPREHSSIWADMSQRGAVISEYAPGSKAESYKFPLRNRIIAGLSDVLVVVESRSIGGSMLTVNEAITRGVSVMAVPGPPHLSSSQGTNDLIRDGCAPVTSTDDVLMALGLQSERQTVRDSVRTSLTTQELRVIDAMNSGPVTVDELALRLGDSLVDVAVLLGKLEANEVVAHCDGWWEALIR